MKVLFIVGTNLSKNTSANMSHNAFIQGFLENGCEVDVIMKNDSWGEEDNTLKRFEKAKYFVYQANGLHDKLKRKFIKSSGIIGHSNKEVINSVDFYPITLRAMSLCRAALKRLYYTFFPVDKVYPLDKVWLKHASKFKSKVHYDIVVSNSSPAASHKLAIELIDKHHISFTRWCQIWEDPMSHDVYSEVNPLIEKEERALLQAAFEVYYVSPLTTQYQKKFFPESANKMRTVPLPFFSTVNSFEKRPSNHSKLSYGYFGDYYSQTRNLQPFYNALLKNGKNGFIYGDTDLVLPSTEKVQVSGRVTLDVLKDVERSTDVLVHLCNLRGGQIPGKIYHYSATAKPILFILDGTEDEQKILKEFFGKFNRYVFAANTEEDILRAMTEIEQMDSMEFKPIGDFSPKHVVKLILNRHEH